MKISERIIYSLVEKCDNMKLIYLVHVALFIIISSFVFVSGFTPELLA
jgi:hypothetical protein